MKTLVINLKLLLILFLLLISCSGINSRKAEKYYPSKHFFERQNLKEISLMDVRLSQLPYYINTIYEMDSTPYFTIKNKSGIIKIMPLMSVEGGFYRERNYLSISEDSILLAMSSNYHLSELDIVLERHYSNNGSDPRYPDSYKKAFIEFTLDTSLNGRVLEKIIMKTVESFERIKLKSKGSLELKIGFSNLRFTPPPPKIGEILEYEKNVYLDFDSSSKKTCKVFRDGGGYLNIKKFRKIKQKEGEIDFYICRELFSFDKGLKPDTINISQIKDLEISKVETLKKIVDKENALYPYKVFSNLYLLERINDTTVFKYKVKWQYYID